jgi:hypothetical protein
MTPVLDKLVPESFGLIHEYYTPMVVAEAIFVNDGIGRALEPSVGIGRLIRAFGPRRWLALEVGGQIGLIVAKPPYQIEEERTLP